jgi:hypothetical protein
MLRQLTLLMVFSQKTANFCYLNHTKMSVKIYNAEV